VRINKEFKIEKKKKNKEKVNIGTKNHPIKLKKINDGDYSESKERLLLHKHTKKKIKGKEDLGDDSLFKFKKLEVSGDEYFTFSHNLISNPILTPQEIKLGLVLYYLLVGKKWGDIFITASRTLNYDNLEELFVRKGKKLNMFRIDENSILKGVLLNDFNTTINNQRLNEAITRLHQFGYITVTEVTPDNLYYKSRKRWNTAYPDKIIGKTNFRAYLKHIVLNPNMEKKILVNRWFK
jgi:hypothetical protein